MREEYLFDVQIGDNLNLDDYNGSLSKNIDWKSTYRDIKLNYLLEENKKIQFDIENIQKYITFDDNQSVYVTLQKICCSINSMTFILRNNKIEKLTLKVEILDTPQGKLLSSIIDKGNEVIVEQFLYEDILNFKINSNPNYDIPKK